MVYLGRRETAEVATTQVRGPILREIGPFAFLLNAGDQRFPSRPRGVGGTPLRQKDALYRLAHLASGDFPVDSFDGGFFVLGHAET